MFRNHRQKRASIDFTYVFQHCFSLNILEVNQSGELGERLIKYGANFSLSISKNYTKATQNSNMITSFFPCLWSQNRQCNLVADCQDFVLKDKNRRARQYICSSRPEPTGIGVTVRGGGGGRVRITRNF